jgi:magnesium transporter
MLTIYNTVDGVLIKQEAALSIGDHTIWIDLLNPTRDEDLFIEKSLGIKIPTREEMLEIEASSRIYQEGGAHYMTAIVLHQKEIDTTPKVHLERVRPGIGDKLPPVPSAEAVTFVLSGNHLVTVRYAEPRAFAIFLSRNQKGDTPCTSGCSLMIGLLEAIIDREADRVERLQTAVGEVGHAIFDVRGGQQSKSRRYDLAVRQIGREGEMTSRSRESLQSLERILGYLTWVMGERNDDKHLRARTKTASRDVAGLNDQVNYLSNKVQFLLDATLGMINIEQSNIIKFFTVVSVALMPPTLIASSYGMNFKHMPELEWTWGYPMAIGLMIVSAIVPFAYFRKKGWL